MQQPANPPSSHYELFGLTPRFALDQAALDAAYRQIQAQVHPDRHAGRGDAERRVAMQWTTRVNEAYHVLKHPLRRAVHLLEMQGIDPRFETDTAMPPAFLIRQMDLREALEEAQHGNDPAALEGLRARLRAEMRSAEAELGRLIDQARDYATAVSQVRELMFLEKLDAEIDAALEALDA